MPYTRWHFTLGLHGLAILRTGSTATDEQLDELAAQLTDVRPTDPHAMRVAGGGAEHDVMSGYARWAPVYDAPGNPLVDLEQPEVWRLLEQWPSGARVLDAACGTGRHTLHLADLGYDVTGIDQSREMLGTAVAKRGARPIPFVRGSAAALPFPSDAFDAAVCALLFDHLPEIDSTVAELARVVRPGGRVLISNIHPAMTLVGANASFQDADDAPNYMPSTFHSVSTYLRSFREHGLTVVQCVEPCWNAEIALAKFPYVSDAVREAAVVGLPMALVWELAA